MKTQIPDPQVAHENKPSLFKRLGLGAFTISLMVHGLFLLIAILFLYKWVYPPEPPASFTSPGGDPGRNETSAKIKPQARQTMPVSMVDKGRIAIPGVSDYSVPAMTPGIGNASLPADLSVHGVGGIPGGGPGGPGTGSHPGFGRGPGTSERFMTPFGTNIAIDGAMPGHFYDFKQAPNGKPTEGYDVRHYEDFTSRVSKIQEDGFRPAAFRKFFVAPDTLYLTQLAIPVTDANAGPKFFNVADKVKPSGWLVHYQGAVSVDRDITFRFVGVGDDYLGVSSKSRMRLIAAWPGVRPQVIGRWKPEEPIDDKSATPMAGCGLTTGQWITLKRGESLDLDIGIGECPGGKVGFVLMVEEKNVDYRIASNGAKVLPLFTTQPISKTSRERITKDFPNWEFQWENVPVFAVDKTSGMGSDFR